jgi:hypothetical protein
MKRFYCTACRQQVFFSNTTCENCRSDIGFDAEAINIVAFAPNSRPRCANYSLAGCNWLLTRQDDGNYCRACRHNRKIPDLSVADNVRSWSEFERAKRRLFYALLVFGLPIRTRQEDATHGLAFECVDDVQTPGGDSLRAITGHDNGVITIALAEADPGRREQARMALGETYRTLLGHLRHEIGHYYWDILVRDRRDHLDRFRELFGNEQIDYGEALKMHYAKAPDDAWRGQYITSYASSHPWEDFAETWQHYMHIVDTLDTAHAFDVAVSDEQRREARTAPFDAYHTRSIDRLIAAWTPLTIAVNCLNRSMGQPDLYPFVLTPPAIAKLDFVRDIVSRAGERGR